jgi:hypothetical protein
MTYYVQAYVHIYNVLGTSRKETIKINCFFVVVTGKIICLPHKIVKAPAASFFHSLKLITAGYSKTLVTTTKIDGVITPKSMLSKLMI